MFDSFVEREKKIAGSQVTMMLFLVCSDDGEKLSIAVFGKMLDESSGR